MDKNDIKERLDAVYMSLDNIKKDIEDLKRDIKHSGLNTLNLFMDGKIESMHRYFSEDDINGIILNYLYDNDDTFLTVSRSDGNIKFRWDLSEKKPDWCLTPEDRLTVIWNKKKE